MSSAYPSPVTEGSGWSPSPFSSPSISITPSQATRSPISINFEYGKPDVAPGETFSGIANPDLHRQYGEEMVELLIGPRHHRATFRIHKHLLTNNSTYFRKFFAEFPHITSSALPDINPTTFHEIYKWLYDGETNAIAQDVVLQRLNDGRHGVQSMIGFYVVAHTLGITPLEDLAMDLIGNGYAKSNLHPTDREIEIAYEQTSPGSMLCRYMARHFQQKILTSIATPIEEVRDLLLRYPALAIETVVLSRGVLTNGLWRTEVLPTCEFHMHAPEETCPNGKLSFKFINYGAVGFPVVKVLELQQGDTTLR